MQTRLIMLPLRTSLFQKLFVFAARLHPNKGLGSGALHFEMHIEHSFSPSDINSQSVKHVAKRLTQIHRA